MKRPYFVLISKLAFVLVGLITACLPTVTVSEAAVLSCSGGDDCPGEFVCVQETSRCVGVTSCVEVVSSIGTPVNDGAACQTLAGTEGVCLAGRCKIPACGDGELDEAIAEECDEGPLNSDSQVDACRLDCSRPACGDGVVDTGEECDQNSITPTGARCSSGCYFQCPVGLADFGTDGTCDITLDLAEDCVVPSNLVRAGEFAYAICLNDIIRVGADEAGDFQRIGNNPETIVASNELLVVGGYEFLEVYRLATQRWESFELPLYASASVAATSANKIWFAGLNSEVYELDVDTGAATVVATIEREKTHMSLSDDGKELLIGNAAGEFFIFNTENADLDATTTVNRGIAGAILTATDMYWLDNLGAQLWKYSRESSTVTLIASAHGTGISMKREGDMFYFLAGTPQDAHLFEVPVLSEEEAIPRAIASLAVPTDFAVLDTTIVIADANLIESLDPTSPYIGGFFVLERESE